MSAVYSDHLNELPIDFSVDPQVAQLRVPPHSIEAESSVLGGLLLDNGAWDRVGEPSTQARLQAEFDRRFPHPVSLVAAPHEESNHGIHRISRFERS